MARICLVYLLCTCTCTDGENSRPWADLEPLGAAWEAFASGAGAEAARVRKSAARRLDRVRCSAAPLDVAVVGGSMTYGVLCNEKAAAGGALGSAGMPCA